MRPFLKNSFVGMMAVGCRLGSSFVLNKIIAGYFGPAGLVQLAQFQNLLAFFTIIPNDGINRGTIKQLAGKAPASAEYRRYFRAGWFLTGLSFVVTAVAVVIARRGPLAYFPADPGWWALFLAGAFLLVLQGFFNAVLLARQRPALVAVGQGLAALLVVFYAGLAYQTLRLPQFLIGYLLVMSSLVGYSWLFALKDAPSVKIKFRSILVSGAAAKELGKYMLMALSVLLFSKGVEFYLRDYLIQHFSLSQAGLWQGVGRISDAYTAIYTAVLAYAFYPKAAAYAQDSLQLQVLVQQVLKLLVPVVGVGLIVVYVAREYIITGLLSDQFLAAQPLLPYQLAGDFFKLISWLLANVLVAQGRVGVVVLFEGLSAAAYVGFFYFFTDTFGLTGSTMAHLANYAFFLALNVFYFRKLLFT